MKKEMRNDALIVLPTDVIGGAEKVAMNLVEYLYENNVFSKIDIYFMSRGRSGRWSHLENKDGISLYYNESRSEKAAIPSLTKFILINRRQYGFFYTTHIHINAYLSLLFFLGVSSKSFKVARESTVISDRFFGIRGFLMGILYKLYGSHDLLICQTEYMRDCLVEKRGTGVAKNIAVIPNPILFKKLNSYNESYSCVNSKIQDKFIILMVGRLVEVKNHALALNALAVLNAKQLIPAHVRLVIVGDGPLRNELISLAEKLKITEQVEFIGQIDSPYEQMANAAIGLLTSTNEGFPNVLLEMMACGTKNIISTPCAGDLDKIDGLTILKDFESATLAAQLQQAIHQPLDYSNQYLKQALKRDVSEYWNCICHFANSKLN